MLYSINANIEPKLYLTIQFFLFFYFFSDSTVSSSRLEFCDLGFFASVSSPNTSKDMYWVLLIFVQKKETNITTPSSILRFNRRNALSKFFVSHLFGAQPDSSNLRSYHQILIQDPNFYLKYIHDACVL